MGGNETKAIVLECMIKNLKKGFGGDYGVKWEKEMTTHSSIPAWRILWTEELGGLLSIALQSRTQLKGFSMHVCIGEGNGNPLKYACLEKPSLVCRRKESIGSYPCCRFLAHTLLAGLLR